MKKKILSLFLALVLVVSLVPITASAVSHGSNGIYANGSGGVYIDIYSYEFTKLSETPTWGQYAWGPSGCAWFASARQWQITGNNPGTIYGGPKWWNNGNGRMGYKTGKTIAANSIACYDGHVAIIEKVNTSNGTALVSEGGRRDHPETDYCTLEWITISYIESSSRGFLGYVYLGGSAPSLQCTWETPSATKITQTNAFLYGKLNYNQNANCTQCGVRLINASTGASVASKDEYVNYKYNYVDMWYDITDELGVTLTPGTTYKYNFYAIINGKEYWSPVGTFTTTGHTHSYTSTVTKPTCTAQGYTTHTCSCGNSYKDSYTNALGHNYGAWKQNKAPTCTAQGTEKRTCTRCSASQTRTVAATGHHYNAATVAPTCTAQGYTTHTCACGSSYVDSYINALGHNYSNGKCTRCGAADPKYVSAPTLKITTVSGHPKIYWNSVSGATKYWIYRSTDGKNFKYYDSTTKTSYTNNATTIGTLYYYKVKAVKVVDGTNKASGYSNTKSIRCKPAAPSLSIARSNGKPQIYWNSVDSATKYWIYRSTDGVNFSYYDSTTKTSYTNKSTTKGKTYYYKVKAVKVIKGSSYASAYSNTKSLTPSK